MPKEQPCLSERGPRTSSKNAKDKSNSSALLALRGTADADNFSGRGSRCSSEKDSGYSDYGSDWHHTDAEDQQSSVSQPRGGGGDQAPEQGQGLGQGRTDQPPRLQESSILLPPNSGLAPIYVLKNVVLKQPEMVQSGGDPLQTQLIWGAGGGEASTSGATHMILLQQPSIAPALPVSPQLRKPLSRRINSVGRKTNGTYLPILNSYPRIAPHPSKKPPDNTFPSQDSQSLRKRVCTENERDEVSATSSLPKHHPCKQTESRVFNHSYSNSNGCSPSSPTTVTSSLGSPSVSSLDTSCTTSSCSSPHSSSSPLLASRGPQRNGHSSARHRRFLNTVEILSQSGLLDITLRTQELLRQSNATEHDIAQLRQHTQLLCQAANDASDSLEGNTAWEKLHQAMAQSGGYPSLKILQNEITDSEPETAGQPDPGSKRDANGPTAARAQAATPMPDQSQNCPVPQLSVVNWTSPLSHFERGSEYKASGRPSEKVTIMPPDSSTGGDVL